MKGERLQIFSLFIADEYWKDTHTAAAEAAAATPHGAPRRAIC